MQFRLRDVFYYTAVMSLVLVFALSYPKWMNQHRVWVTLAREVERPDGSVVIELYEEKRIEYVNSRGQAVSEPPLTLTEGAVLISILIGYRLLFHSAKRAGRGLVQTTAQ